MTNQKKDLNKRNWAFGINSAFITIVVIAIIGVLNFLSTQYPHKYDATKNKLNTFSDQSAKVMKNLKSDLKATLFGDFGAREKYRPILDNYKKLSSHFKFELVDPNKEPTRTKQANIKKPETLLLEYQGKTSKVEDITEEKVTNEVIKLTKETHSIACSVIGHGEPSFTGVGGGDYQAAKKGLEDQAYDVKEISLPEQTKIPAECTVVIMMGASKGLFPSETKALEEYLGNGGRLIVSLDATLSQTDQSKELKAFLSTWGIDYKTGLVIDPVSRMLGVDASVPIIAQFNKDSPVTKDFTQQSYFPFTRPMDLVNPAPAGLKTIWLAKTTPKAWGEMDMKSIAKGEVQYNAGIDIAGPVTVAIAVSGRKLSPAVTPPAPGTPALRQARIVAFGSSQFANNQYSRFGGNLDLFLNAVSWAMEDESLISIRTKEDESGKIELSQTQGMLIFWLSVVIFPLLIAIAGIVIWVRRKKL
jgi:ABC-type uncharacterized transport system involved in gliding motility auxiliary subunit